MRKRILGVGSALAVALGLVGIVGFRCGGQCHRGDPAQAVAMVNEQVDDMLDDVQATPDQRTRIRAVVDRVLADGRKVHEAHASIHGEVLAQWRSDRPDAARLHAIVEQRSQAMRAFADEAVDAGIEIHGLLTPEQREIVAKKAERSAHP